MEFCFGAEHSARQPLLQSCWHWRCVQLWFLLLGMKTEKGVNEAQMCRHHGVPGLVLSQSAQGGEGVLLSCAIPTWQQFFILNSHAYPPLQYLAAVVKGGYVQTFGKRLNHALQVRHTMSATAHCAAQVRHPPWVSQMPHQGDTGRFALVPVNTATCKTTHMPVILQCHIAPS
jgi:hypothetical protein